MAETVDQSESKFNDMLTGYRRRAGVSQEKLGTALGFSQSDISRMEHSQVEPPLDPVFYVGIRKSLYLTSEEILILAKSAGAPPGFIEELSRQSQFVIATAYGISASVTTTDPKSLLRPDELYTLNQIIRLNTELVIAEFFQDKVARARLIRKQE